MAGWKLSAWCRKWAGLPLLVMFVAVVVVFVGMGFGFIEKDQSLVLSRYWMRSLPLAIGLMMVMAQDASIAFKRGVIRITMRENPVQFWLLAGGLVLLGASLLLSQAFS